MDPYGRYAEAMCTILASRPAREWLIQSVCTPRASKQEEAGTEEADGRRQTAGGRRQEAEKQEADGRKQEAEK